MVSMAGVMNTFSTAASMAAPGNYDHTNDHSREAGRLYCLQAYRQRGRDSKINSFRGAARPGLKPRVYKSPIDVADSNVGPKGPTPSGLRDRGIVLQVDPSPRSRLGTFNGRRPTRESLIGNGGGAPPVSRFLYRPHYRRRKSE